MTIEYAFITNFCELEILCFRKFHEKSIETSFNEYLKTLKGWQRSRLIKLRDIKTNLTSNKYNVHLKPSYIDALVSYIENVHRINEKSP